MSEKIHAIPYHDSYGITKTGVVYDIATQTPLNPILYKKKYYVYIDGELIEIAKLVLNTYIGDMPSKICYKTSPEFYDTKSIEYEIGDIFDYSEDEVLIDDILFRRMKKYKYYFISSDGVIYSMYYNRFVEKSFNHKEYPTVALVDNTGFRSPRKVHRLVYETYIGELDPALIVDHLNGKKWCSSFWNLEQINQRENVRRAYATGLNPIEAWVYDDVEKVCKLMEDGYTFQEIMKEMEIDESSTRRLKNLIQSIKSRSYHKEISSKYNIDNYAGSSINENSINAWKYDDVRKVCQLMEDSCTFSEIVNAFDVDASDPSVRLKFANLIAKLKSNKYHRNISKDYKIENYSGKYRKD